MGISREQQLINADNNKRYKSLVYNYLLHKGLINQQLGSKMMYHKGLQKLLTGYTNQSWKVIKYLGKYLEEYGTHEGFNKYTRGSKKQHKKRKVNKVVGFYQSREWRELRVQAFIKYGRKCCLCGRGVEHGVILHVDHIKPKSKYPHLSLRLDNMQILCEDCNLGKSNKYEEQWRD